MALLASAFRRFLNYRSTYLDIYMFRTIPDRIWTLLWVRSSEDPILLTILGTFT